MDSNIEDLKKQLDILEEGQIKFYSYEPKDYSTTGSAMTKSMPVFYNPVMAINRDLTLLAYAAYQKEHQQRRPTEVLKICDSMAASGIRALRLLKFLPPPVQIIANDLNGLALKFIQENEQLNGFKDQIILEKNDANMLFRKMEQNQDYQSIIDIDPFGTPNRFIESAYVAMEVGGLMAVTATDVPVLFGVRQDACYRKYNSRSLHTTFLKELGIRILLYFIASRGHTMNYSIEPYLSFSAEHFVRVFVKIIRGKEGVGENLKQIGFVRWCPHCDWRATVPYNLKNDTNVCPDCGKITDIAGPLWTGQMHKQDFVNTICSDLSKCTKELLPSKKKLEKLLLQIQFENNFPLGYFHLAKMCDRLEAPVPSVEKFIEVLIQKGFHAGRTHFDPVGVKSDASVKLINELLSLYKVK